jgi:hypothetical protein
MTFIRRHNIESSVALKRNANGKVVSQWPILSLCCGQNKSLNIMYFDSQVIRSNYKRFLNQMKHICCTLLFQ